MNIEPNQMALIFFSPGSFIFVLGISPAQPRTQSLTRSILNRYPEIAGRDWTWKKGEGLSLSNSRDKVKFIMPPVTHSPHPDYPGVEPKLPIKLAIENGYRYVLNPFKNGVEIYFNGPVPSELTMVLKANGFRYSGKMKLWYSKQTANTMLFARRMKG
jgi:hypothetical protein